MQKLIQIVFAGVFWLFVLLFTSCKKDTVSKYDTAVVNMKIYDDDSIALPVTVTAGDNCLLSAYNVTSGEMKFNLTDNNGKLIWQKEFGVKSISAILKENDGTFTIFSGNRFINIDLQGNIVKDDQFKNPHIPTYFEGATFFSARINKNNNYLFTGVYAVGFNGVNRAFAAEYTHNGDSVFLEGTSIRFTTSNIIGNYSVITGCEETDDGYVFFGSFFGYGNSLSYTAITFNIIRTNNLGEVIWQNNNLLVDSQHVSYSGSGPFTAELPFSTDVYGFHPQSFTHEVIRTASGDYLCFLNKPNYISTDQRARVYKIDPNGNMLDSAFIDFGKYNRYMGGLANYYKYTNHDISYSCGNGVVRNADNTFSICMQNGFFGSKGLTTSYLGESNSFVVRIDQDLNILNTHNLQNYYSDCFNSACKSSDGKTIYFGLISSFAKSYKPALIFSNDN